MSKRLVVLGGGESGAGAAVLAKVKGDGLCLGRPYLDSDRIVRVYLREIASGIVV